MGRLRLGDSLCVRYGIPLVNDGRPFMLLSLRSGAGQEGPVLLTKKRPPPLPEPSLELSRSELIPVDEEEARRLLGSGPKPAEETSEELTTSDFMFPSEQRKGPPPPPAPKKKPFLPKPTGRPSRPPAQPAEVSKESEEALALLHEIGLQKAAELPKEAPPPLDSPSSVILSLEELRRMEAERVAKEGPIAPRKAPEPAAPEEGSVEASLNDALRMHMETISGAEEAGIPIDVEEPVEEISDRYIVSESSASIKVRLGVPWEDGHGEHRLSAKEEAECRKHLPERELRWIMPVPPLGTQDKGEKGILKGFANEPQVELNGKAYYIFKTRSEGGFGGARMVARTGVVIHIWPSAMTDYSFEGDVSMEKDLRSGQWPVDFEQHLLTPAELKAFQALLPESVPLWLHPVPDSATQTDLEKSILEECTRKKTPTVMLGGKEYYVLQIESVEEWKNTVFFFRKTRMAVRKGHWLGLWPEHENGRALLAEEHGYAPSSGKKGAPLLPTRTSLKPYEEELEPVWQAYGRNGKRWLYPVPDKLGRMNADTLNFLVSVSNEEIKRNNYTPLLTLQGRWYIALRHAHPEARLSWFSENMVHVEPLAAPKETVDEGVRSKRINRIVIPDDEKQKEHIYGMFPEGKVKHLLCVESAGSSGPAESDIVIMRGTESVSYTVHDSPVGNSTPWARKGNIIYPITKPTVPLKA